MTKNLRVQEKKFVSEIVTKDFDGKDYSIVSPNVSPLYSYLNSVCISNPHYTDDHPNFFDGEVLAHVGYHR
jgi:hypothetical protein